jgi:hypothetical protein
MMQSKALHNLKEFHSYNFDLLTLYCVKREYHIQKSQSIKNNNNQVAFHKRRIAYFEAKVDECFRINNEIDDRYDALMR